jgi:hypothetical protein
MLLTTNITKLAILTLKFNVNRVFIASCDISSLDGIYNKAICIVIIKTITEHAAIIIAFFPSSFEYFSHNISVAKKFDANNIFHHSNTYMNISKVTVARADALLVLDTENDLVNDVVQWAEMIDKKILHRRDIIA